MMSDIQLNAPAPLMLADGETERDAVLLECCHLPDKQLTLTEQDLDGIAARFTGDVPIKVQHVDSPLDPFGVVKSVRRVGKQLFAKIVFPTAIANLVRERGAAALSCGLDRSPLALAEVSLVVKGRIPAAVLLSEEDAAELVRLRAENAVILAQSNAQRVDAQIVQLKLAGKVIPATEAAARVLLSASDTTKIVLTDGHSLSVSEAFTAFLSALPPLITLGEINLYGGASGAAGSGGGAGSERMMGEETLDEESRAWLEKTLGVKAEDVQKTMAADRKAKADEMASPMARKG